MMMVDPGFATVIGCALAVPGGICLALAVAVGRDLDVMRRTPTSRNRDLSHLPPGTQVEVCGLLRGNAPLRAGFSHRPCACFDTTVIHEERDPDASFRPGAGRRDNIASSTGHAAPCRVEDASGAVVLTLDGAEVDGLPTLKERGEITARSFSTAGFHAFGDGCIGVGSDVLAIRRKEAIPEIDAPVYVLAVLRADGLLGTVRKGERGRFLVSRRSEAGLTRSKILGQRILGSVALLVLPGSLGCLGLALASCLAR